MWYIFSPLIHGATQSTVFCNSPSSDVEESSAGLDRMIVSGASSILWLRHDNPGLYYRLRMPLCPAQLWKGMNISESPFIDQISPSTILELSGFLNFNPLLLNQQTVVYSFIGAKLNKRLQEGYSYKNLQHKFKFCFYLQNGLIK